MEHEQKSGVINRGYEYEKVVPALFGLKLLFDQNVRDFIISPNPSRYEKFDDLSIKVTYSDGSKNEFLCQLKHREKSKDVIEAKVLFSKKNYKTNKTKGFSIFEYEDFYLKNNGKFPQNCKLVLFTNTQFQNIESNANIQVKPLRPELPTDKQKTVYQFKKTDENSSDFYDKFYLYSEQRNKEEILNEIEEIFLKTFHSTPEKAICYVDFFQNVRERNFNNTNITRDQIIVNLMKLLMFDHIIKPSFNKKNTKIELIEKCVQQFDVTVLPSMETNFISDNWSYDTKLSDLQSESLINFAVGIKLIANKKVEDPGNDLLQFAFYLQRSILFLHVTKTLHPIISSLVPFIKTLQCKLSLILVGKDVQGNEHFKVFRKLDDLLQTDKALFHKMTKQLTVSVEGREVKSIAELEKSGVKVNNMITTREIFQSLEGHVLLGEKIQELPESYIPRALLKSKVDIAQLQELCYHKTTIVNCQGKSKEFRQAIIENGFTLDIVSMKESPNKAPHLILTDKHVPVNEDANSLVLQNDSLEWTDCKVPASVCSGFQNHVNLLIDEPGSGKTTLLKYLAKNCPENHWVAFIPLREKTSILEKETSTEGLVREFLGCNDEHEHLCDHFLSIVLLFDGLNELNSDFRNKAINAIKKIAKKKYQVWVSGTTSLKTTMERSFKSPHYFTVEALSEKEQQMYIEERLRKADLNSQSIKNIMRNCFSTKLTKTPLNLYILTEVLQNKECSYTNFNVSQLYTSFMRKKLDHFLQKRTSVNLEQIRDILKSSTVFYMRGYQNVALRACLEPTLLSFLTNVYLDRRFVNDLLENRTLIEIMKIDENENLSLRHHTFSEYFTAMWLIEHFNDVPEEERKFIFHIKHTEVRKFIDYELGKDCYLHLAILNRDLEAVKRHAPEHLDDVDARGRTPLHLAVLLGKKHLPYKENQVKIICDKDFAIQAEILKYLLDCRQADFSNFFFKKDTLLEWNVFQYADASLCLEALEELSKKISNQWESMPRFFDDLKSLSYHCVASGYINLLKSLITRTSLQDLDEQHSKPLLQVAIANHHQEVFEFLIQNDLSLNRTDPHKKTHLHVAAICGNFKAANLLIQKNIDIEAKSLIGKTALHYAATMGHLAIVELLVKQGQSVNLTDNQKKTPLHLARRADIVKYLLEKNPDVNASTVTGGTALHRAAEAGLLEIVVELLDKNVDKDKRDDFGMTALHYATKEGHEDVVSHLVTKGIDVFVEDDVGDLASDIAKDRGHDNIAKLLEDTEKKNRKRRVNSLSDETVFVAAIKGNLENIMEHLESGKNIEKTNDRKETILHVASAHGHVNIVKHLLKEGADPGATNVDNRVPLHLACQKGHTEVVKTLLNKEQNLVKDKRGITPIHWAAYKGHTEIVEILADADVELNTTSNTGRTPLHAAAHNRHTRVIKLLLSKGADVRAVDNKRQTCLHVAVSKMHDSTVRFLVKHCKDIINKVDSDGNTALHLAARRNNKKTVMALLEHGADVNLQNSLDQTPSAVAVEANHKDVIECFEEWLTNI